MEDIEILVKCPVFFSDVDEANLFGWFKQIPAVKEVRGKGRELSVAVSLKGADEEGIRELIAVFQRYGLDMKELAKFDVPEFSEWFRNPKAYWHDQVFDDGIDDRRKRSADDHADGEVHDVALDGKFLEFLDDAHAFFLLVVSHPMQAACPPGGPRRALAAMIANA